MNTITANTAPGTIGRMTAKQAKTKPVSRHRVDWPAAERDFRTGKFSQVEISRLHGMAEATLCRRIKRDQKTDPSRWQPDLTLAVRQATNAALMAELVKTEINDGQELVKNSILAAAEIGKNVIMRHRQDLLETRDVAMGLLAELKQTALLAEEQDVLIEILAGAGATDVDVDKARKAVRRAIDLGERVGSVKQLADTFTKLQISERKAHSMDDADPGKGNGDPENNSMTTAELAVKLAYIMEGAAP